eukprot:CAMPEP_0170949708 /NCGR_PEP_ID=MMETSP0735-20130129/29455_1 /TAXON_ID=186038 /ORGANISM="Fragilariopsis kerguelensis, Strain L26-C5" /LENGTH=569 /DNA_ID=CAMNT_0011359861 /DNA_START=302 /DNA_END=2011 /DNA_ORIENTATION=+
MTKPNNTIVDVARKDKDLSIFVDALTHARLIDKLSSVGRYTVFCASNAVWKKKIGVSGDITKVDPQTLTKILRTHIVPKKIYKAADMSAGLTLHPLFKGETLTISGFVGKDQIPVVSVNNQRFTNKLDIMASNGVIHQIDGILFPPGLVIDKKGTTTTLAALQHWLKTTNGNDEKQKLEDQAFATVSLSKTDDQKAREMLWKFYQQKIQKDPTRRKEMLEDKRITYEYKNNKYVMPIWYKTHGPKNPPNKGRSLYISLHGGGGTAVVGQYTSTNNVQWANQKILYESKNLPIEGIYCAPRAPTDTWDLWHTPQIYPMLSRLIGNFIIFEQVNPNKVYIMGYSAGGDGTYRLASRMADRWAASAACAGHPGAVTTKEMVDSGCPCTVHVGANDSGSNRNVKARQWKTELAKLDPDEKNDYVEIHAGRAHEMKREEAVVFPWMAQRTRELRPTSIVWQQQPQNPEQRRFYWLAVETPTPGTTITATRHTNKKNTIEIGDGGGTIPSGVFRIRLDDQMEQINLEQKMHIKTASNVVLYEGLAHRTIGTLYTTLVEREDPTGMFSTEIEIKIG